MPTDFGITVDDKREIARLIDQGWGMVSLAKRYGVNDMSAAIWFYAYRALGLDGLLNMGSKHKTYGYDTKLAAARACVEDGMSLAEAMAEFGILSLTSLKRWCRAYREDGPEALRPKPKGRPKGAANKPKEPESELERLRAENERLRCALEVQKRLDALALKKKRQGARRPR